MKPLIITLLLCASCNSTQLRDSDAIVSSDKKDTLMSQLRGVSNMLSRTITLSFFNNPWGVTEKDHLILLINEYVIYNGKFKNGVEIKMPIQFENRKNSVKFILTRNSTNYIFNTMQLVELSSNDNKLQIVFLPKESDWFTFYFNFTSTNKHELM